MKQYKQRLGVLYFLLNMSTEYDHSDAEVCAVMDSIKRDFPEAAKAHFSNIQIIVDDKVVFAYKKNEIRVDE